MANQIETYVEPFVESGPAPLEDPSTRLSDLKAQATLKYSVKDYNTAAELYSKATELQAEINGEMSPDNADLLYAYGRCLYHVAVKNSEVLGSKVAGQQREEKPKKPPRRKRDSPVGIGAPDEQDTRVADEVVTKVVEEKDGPVNPLDKDGKPYFQFTGDENWVTDDEEEDEEAEGEDEEGDEEDDFVNAYEVLDLARVLLVKRIEADEGANGKSKGKRDSEETQRLNERLADTYDLQAEISLEGERFPAAVVDLKSALELKERLYQQDSSILAEAHYKLSLALEFSSVTQQKNENGEVEGGTTAQVDDAMREEAAVEMEAAIASCQMRIKREEAKLQETNGDAGHSKTTREQIDEVKDMVRDMEQRVTVFSPVYERLLTINQLVELRQPPVSINDPTGTGTLDGSNPLSGILGSILGESPAAQKARLEEASRGATDLTNLVKKKKPAHPESDAAGASGVQTNGKRKADEMTEDKKVDAGKKAKVSEG